MPKGSTESTAPKVRGFPSLTAKRRRKAVARGKAEARRFIEMIERFEKRSSGMDLDMEQARKERRRRKMMKDRIGKPVHPGEEGHPFSRTVKEFET